MGLKIASIEKKVVADEGEWQDVTDWGVDPVTGKYARLCVRPLSCKAYQTDRELLIQRLTKRLKRPPTNPEMEPELGAIVAQHLLRGWDGIDGNDGKPLLWSMETGVEYLTNPLYRELEAQTILAAARLDDVEAEFTAAAAKN